MNIGLEHIAFVFTTIGLSLNLWGWYHMHRDVRLCRQQRIKGAPLLVAKATAAQANVVLLACFLLWSYTLLFILLNFPVEWFLFPVSLVVTAKWIYWHRVRLRTLHTLQA